MFKIERTGSYYAIKIKALNGFEQGTCYFFSYRFYNAVHWKRRDGEKIKRTVAETKVWKKDLHNLGKHKFTYQSRDYNKPIAARKNEVALAGGKLDGRPWHRPQEKVNKFR